MVSERNRKIYKELINSNINMNPGNPKELSDESFSRISKIQLNKNEILK